MFLAFDNVGQLIYNLGQWASELSSIFYKFLTTPIYTQLFNIPFLNNILNGLINFNIFGWQPFQFLNDMLLALTNFSILSTEFFLSVLLLIITFRIFKFFN